MKEQLVSFGAGFAFGLGVRMIADCLIDLAKGYWRG